MKKQTYDYCEYYNFIQFGFDFLHITFWFESYA